MNKNIAVLTAGILAVGLLGIASHTGSAWAASSGGTANFGGMFTSHAEAAPGQSSSSSFGFTQLVPPQIAVGNASAASEDGTVSTAAGQSVACGNGVNAVVGVCAQANH